MTDTNTYQAQANELSQKLWAIANDLRGQMDASEFKNYILGVIFYRYLSERTEMYMTDLLKNDDGITYEEAFADDEYRPVVEEWSLSKLGYVIKPENLFRNLIRKITKFENDADKFSVEDFEKAINDLVGSTMGHESNKAFDGLFNDMRLQDSRLGETVSDRTEMIGRVMVRVSDIDFDLQDSQFDVLGTAYMILIGLFASDAGKKGGEFFTPAGPSKLCATLAALGLDEAKTVGDCTCGSASMLLEVQALVCRTNFGLPRRTAAGTDYNRLNLLMAVLEKRLNLPLSGYDAYVNIAGGVRLSEPAMDLALVLAVISSYKDVPVSDKTIVFGEVGLSGEVRAVSMAKQRVQEAKRLGFTKVILPKSSMDQVKDIKGIELIGVSAVWDAMKCL